MTECEICGKEGVALKKERRRFDRSSFDAFFGMVL